MMNLAYLANYQGEDLIARRKVVRNRALAGTQKIATIAALLAAAGCTVQVFSLGAVSERSGRFYRGFRGKLPGVGDISVFYQPEWDLLLLGRILGAVGLVKSLLKANRRARIDAVLVYNCGLPEVIAACALSLLAAVPIILEYEDDVSVGPDGRTGWRQYFHSLGFHIIKRRLQGLIAVSPELLSQCQIGNAYVLRGLIAADIAAVRPLPLNATPQQFMYAGSLQPSKGVDRLCKAFTQIKEHGCKLHIAGQGPMLDALKLQFGGDPRITFHGFGTRDQLIELFGEASILINPHQVASRVGTVFPFKMIEYLGTGRPVISTPMAPLPDQLACGVLYSKSDSAQDLAQAMSQVHGNYREWCERAQLSREAAWSMYGPQAVGDCILQVVRGAIEKTKATTRVVREGIGPPY